MDFKSLIQSLDTINEDSTVHKGTYGTSYGKEDVRDQYGHRIGRVDKDKESKKDEPKKGRGRPKKGSDGSGEVKSYDTKSLHGVFGGGKKPSKEVGTKSVKHSLKEYIEELENALNEDANIGVKSLPGASEITMNNQPTGITAKDPQSAAKMKDLMSTGGVSVPGATEQQGINNALGEDGVVSEKAKSKAQQRFFGMVHAMQKGKKVPGASKELKDVAKGIGKKDAEDFARTKHKGLPQHVKKTNEAEVEESGLQAYLGNKKYGKEGMDKLRQAGREHASKEKMANIRAKYDKMDESQNTKKQVSESIVTEGAMKDLLINFHDDVHRHMGDGSVFDLKKAHNVQQAEEVLKALVKHSDEYNTLDHVNQNELVNQTLKYLAHEKELPFNALQGLDKQRFATRPTADLSSYRQHPGAKPGSDFSEPGSPMALPRTSPVGSNGFLKTLSTPTLKESNDMKDKQFENWERELNSLLNEGITVSQSTGQHGSPDSLSINATEHDATELMSILRNSGMEMFGGSKETHSGYGAPMTSGEEEPTGTGTEPQLAPTVVGDGDDMLELIKKISGIGTDAGTPSSVEVDYEDEEGASEEGHDSEEGEKQSHDSEEGSGEEAGEESEDEVDEAMYDEGNAFTGKLAQTKQGDSFKMGDKTYKDTSNIEEDDMEEGNMFTGNLAKARAAGKSEADLDGDGDMEKVREGEDTCNECGMYESECGCDHVEEGYANEAGGDAMGETELLNLKELLSRGNDLHRQKHSQATGNVQKVTMENTLLKDSTDLLVDWKKLSGIK